jgi:prevent-host-death family protein
MSSIVNLNEAKKRFDELVDRISDGEDIVIARSGKPVALLTRLKQSAEAAPRQPGMFAGLTVPDTFFDPLPNEELPT